MWNHHKITLVFLTKDNADSIRTQIEEGFLTGYVDEVIVADSSSTDRTLSETSYTKARIASCSNIYEAFRTSIDRALGDLIIFGDPSGIVPSKELVKLLAYSDTSTHIFGSRTRWLLNEISGTDKKAFKINMSAASALSEYTVVTLDDLLPPIFLIPRDSKGPEIRFSGHVNLLPFDVLKNAIEQGSMYFQVPIEYHSYSLDEDVRVFTDRRLRRIITGFKKELKRKDRPSRKMSPSQEKESHSEKNPDYDPVVIKRRLAYLRKRLGDYDKPYISQEARVKIEDAVKKAASKSNSSSTSPRKISRKRQQDR